tara:strand:- start:63 stop:854 length:792 start_codon:yes stop_codon:yes gene_type:complete
MTVALTRGIKVLELLGKQQGMTLSDVSRALSIPKSSTRRLLQTLLEHHLIRQSYMDQKFRSNINLPINPDSSTPENAWLLCDIARKHAHILTKNVRWPSDIFLPFKDGLYIVDSTRSLTDLYLYQSRIYTRVNWIHSAAARVYLAFSDIEKRSKILIDYFANSKKTPAERQQIICDITFDLDEIKKNGFALRTAQYFGESIPYDGLRGMAVPIIINEKVHACINLVWSKEFSSEYDFCRKHLPLLKACADDIAQETMQFTAST